MDPNIKLSNSYGISFQRVLALLSFALLIAILSSLGTYWYKESTKTTSIGIDYSCNTDRDCKIKTVGGQCPSPQCVNKNFIEKPVTPHTERGCVLGYLVMDNCRCVEKMCKGTYKGKLNPPLNLK